MTIPRCERSSRGSPPRRTTRAREVLTWTGPAGRCSVCSRPRSSPSVMIAAQLAGLDPSRPATAARDDRHRQIPTGRGSSGSSCTSRSGKASRSATPPRSRSSTPRPGGSARCSGWCTPRSRSTILVPLLPGVHPRMASNRAGPGVDGGARATRAARPELRRRDAAVAIVVAPRVRHRARPAAHGALTCHEPSTVPIGDYGLIGDTRTAALVSSRRLDRLDVRAALRRRPAVRPPRRRSGRGPLPRRARGRPHARVARRYRPGTATLETTWERTAAA